MIEYIIIITVFQQRIFMFDKDDVKKEHIEKAYELLKNYCEQNKIDMLKFVKNKENIKQASEHIHSQLNFALRLVLKPVKIESTILENHDFIVAKVKEYSKKKKL